jgi:hypothetical protein
MGVRVNLFFGLLITKHHVLLIRCTNINTLLFASCQRRLASTVMPREYRVANGAEMDASLRWHDDGMWGALRGSKPSVRATIFTNVKRGV